MPDKNIIDITYDFSEDYRKKIDPDKYNLILKFWHKILWEKYLPNGNILFSLIETDYGLIHKSDLGEYYLTSDSIVHTYSRQNCMTDIIKQFSKNEIDNFFCIACQIGGYILFPGYKIGNKQTINGARGFNQKIADRFDLTLECIRLYYNNEIDNKINPLGEVLNRYDNFFKLFIDFKGYCEYFLLQDLVTNNYTYINFFLPFNGFNTKPRPNSVDEYRIFMENNIKFVINRNNRIQNYLTEKNKYWYNYYLVKANNNTIFKYIVNPDGQLNNYGSQLCTVNKKCIEGDIKYINENIIDDMKNNNEIVEKVDGRNWNYEKLIDHYFDNEGSLYSYNKNPNEKIKEIYRSLHMSNYLCNNYYKY